MSIPQVLDVLELWCHQKMQNAKRDAKSSLILQGPMEFLALTGQKCALKTK
jgi:hypothetical protein